MDKFDQKFTEFQHELTELTQSNVVMKEKEKKYKRTINQLEVRNLELEEKFKYAHQRNSDLNAQVEFVERDMQKMAKETGEHVSVTIRQVEKTQKREEATDRAFTDIKSMISQFRRERKSSKEALTQQRGVSGGRLSREDSPSDGRMVTLRQSNASPDDWKRQRMSPLRHKQ